MAGSLRLLRVWDVNVRDTNRDTRSLRTFFLSRDLGCAAKERDGRTKTLPRKNTAHLWTKYQGSNK